MSEGEVKKKETLTKTFVVALILCVVCSALVAGANTALKPLIQANKKQFIRQNVLAAAGVFDKNRPVDEQYEEWVSKRSLNFHELTNPLSQSPIQRILKAALRW